MRIYINERIDENNFTEYIKNKLNLKNMEFLGYGFEGVVYAIDKYRVIKFTPNYPSGMQNLLNKSFKHLMNVYTIGKIEVPKKFIEKIGDRASRVSFSTDSDFNKPTYIKGQHIYYIISERLIPVPSLKSANQSKDTGILSAINIIHDFLVNDKYTVHDHDILYDYFNDNYMIKKLALKKNDIKIINQVLLGFKELSENNIIFKDLNRNNIMQNADGVIKIIDYDRQTKEKPNPKTIVKI